MNQIVSPQRALRPITEAEYRDFRALANRDNSYEAGYDGMKEKVLRLCSGFLKRMAVELGAQDFDAKPNPAGQGVSGDIRLKAIVGDRGFHLFGSGDFGYVIRSIKSLKDYSRGDNVQLGKLPERYSDLRAFAARFLDPSISPHTLGSSFCPAHLKPSALATGSQATKLEPIQGDLFASPRSSKSSWEF